RGREDRGGVRHHGREVDVRAKVHRARAHDVRHRQVGPDRSRVREREAGKPRGGCRRCCCGVREGLIDRTASKLRIRNGMTDAISINRDDDAPLAKKLDDLYKLIDGIETAMVTTRRADGHLVARPMQTQRRTTGTDLWFMTNAETEKFEDLARDPHV